MATDDAPNLRRLARQLVDVTRRLKHLETVPQLSHSSLDNQGLSVYDADGNLSVTLGKQSDGTYSSRPVAGPPPPAPVGLDAEGDAGLIHASWQGAFWAGAAMPRDFEAVEVLVDGNVHGAIHDPDGGSVTVPAFAGEREVSFRTLSQAGRRSDATGHVTVTVQSKASVQLDEARGRIEAAEGDLAGAQARIDTALDAEGHVREDEILRNATLLGETVVQEINVTGKLVGTDGVFTGTVDFENVNVTGLQLVEKLEANSISADLIEGGAFTGESFTGGTFTGGLFKTSDALPGQVTLSDTANQGTPGIAVEPDDSSGYDVLPSIGPGPDHMSISGGVSTEGALAGAQFSANGTAIYHNGPGATGGGSWATVGDGEAGLTYRPDRTNASHESAIRARADDAVVYSEGPNGTGFITASPGSAFLQHVGPGDSIARSESSADATPEYLMLERKIPGVEDRHRLVLDDDGVWVKTVFGANPVSYNLLPTVTTSPFAMPPGWEPDGANVAKYTITGGVCWWSGVVKSTGTVASGWTTLGYAPEDAWPKEGDQLRTLPTTSGRTVLGKISAANGRIEIWVDQATSGIFMHFSPFTYLV